MTDYRFGWIPDLPDHRDYLLKSFETQPLAVPSIVDLTNLPINWMYEQGALGSCTGNSSASLFRFVDEKQGGLNVHPSRLQIYYDARKMRGWEMSDAGAYLRDALKVTASIGAAPEEDWPYDISKFAVSPTPDVYAQAAKHQTLAYMRVDQNLSAMRGCIANGFPFVIGSTLYENFLDAGSGGIVQMPVGKEIGGHAYLVVGYNDETKRFKCMNSWGTNWGENGFFYMPYDYLIDDDLSDDLWTIRNVEELQLSDPDEPKPTPGPISFDGEVVKFTFKKLVLDPSTPIGNYARREVQVTVGELNFIARIKHSEDDWAMLKGTFDLAWDLKGKTAHVESL